MVTLRPQRKIWLNGRLEPWNDAKVHVLSHGLHYAYSIFEGIRSHATDAGPAIFRLDEHLKRFANSARIYRMKLPYSVAELRAACVDLVRANGTADSYLRPIAFSGYGEMGLDPTRCRIDTAIAMWPWESFLTPSDQGPGIRATISSWVRVDARSLPPQAKCAANYANGGLAKMEAAAAGYDEAILLNAAGMVAEGTGENLFRVQNGIVSTPPASSGILRGITRDTVIHLLHEEEIPFQRTDFTREELFAADELFLTGTAAGIVPIREVDGRPIGDGRYPIAEKVRGLYDRAVHGRLERHRGWLTFVAPEGEVTARVPTRPLVAPRAAR